MNQNKHFQIFAKNLDSSNKQKGILPLIFSRYKCKIINNILQVSLTQRFQNNTGNESSEILYNLPINQGVCLEQFQAIINGQISRGYVKSVKESQDLYNKGKKEGNIVSHCEKKIQKDNLGQCLEIKLGNIPDNIFVDINLTYSQQLSSILNTFYYVDLSLLLVNQDDVTPFTLDLQCSQRINIFQLFGIPTETNLVDSNNITFNANQNLSQTLNKGESGSFSFKLIYQFEDMHIPQILYGKCESQVQLLAEDKSNKQINLLNHSFLLSFIPNFNEKFKIQINDAIQQSLTQGNDILSENYLKSFNESIIDQSDSSKCEFVFLLDRSGSMSGGKLKNALESLVLFIKSLPLNSYFNVISFGSRYECLFETSQQYSNEAVKKAIEEIEIYSANMGGTEIYKPLEHVFNTPRINGFGRQIYLLTDGQVENKEKVIQLIQLNSTSNRVHSIGIGEDADKNLIVESAQSGKGCYQLVNKQENIQECVIYILQNSISPILESIQITYNKEVFSYQYPQPSDLTCLYKDDLFSLVLFLKPGLDIDNLSPEDKTVKISYFDTSLDQNIEKIILLDPQDAHKYDSELSKSVFKIGMQLKLNSISGLIDSKNKQSNHEENQEIQDVINESIEHQILTKFTSYFCEIEKINDEKRIQYYQEDTFTNNNNNDDDSDCSYVSDLSFKLSEDQKKRNRRAACNLRSRSKSQDKDKEKDRSKRSSCRDSQWISHRRSQSRERDRKDSNESINERTKRKYKKRYDCNNPSFIDQQKEKDKLVENKPLDLQQIISSVNIEGVWTYSEQIALNITKSSIQVLEDVLKLFKSLDIFMTLLMIFILEEKYSQQKQQWILIAKKSNKFIEKEINDNNQLVQLKASISKLCSNS